jgi:CDP-diacylglycerol---glycerol-3-phosphate 3-phosphatidyltransferase
MDRESHHPPDKRPAPDARPPRARDLPAPRRVESAIGPLFGQVFKWPYRFGLAGLYRIGARAWHLTFLSVAVNVVAAWLLATDRRFLPGILLLLAGVLDIVDGGIARLRGEASRAGAFLDSLADRVSDFVILGALFWSLAGQGETLGASLAISSLLVSLLVSHIRAEGEAMRLTLTEGLFQRIERYVALIIGLTLPGALVPVLAILTALGAVTATQRLWSGLRQLSSPAQARSETGLEKE